jgi:cysteinyl-tRNA synthetase
MDINIFNTETHKKELFKPIKHGHISMYHCGPTVYWTQHIGNMRAVVLADLMVRSLRYNDYKVTLVRNYTDVGHLSGDNEGDADAGTDRMEKGAKREGVTPEEIANKYIAIYEKDISDLNVVPADFKPKATAHIPEIIEMVETLLKKGYAYATPLAIYFDVKKAKDYGKLSGQDYKKNIMGAGSGDVADPAKHNHADFAIWFFRAGAHANALQFWPSPFTSPLVENGNGFPGWHIECSAMSKKYLGPTLDIHMGGIEHIPIHHTNEIAQSEAANGVPFVHYWLHNEHLLVNGAKMSKSEGTSFSLAEIEEKGFDPLALRYFFMQSSYRSKQNFTWEALQAAQSGLLSLYKQVNALGTEKDGVDQHLKDDFASALVDDFNMPKALATVSELLHADLPKAQKLSTILDFDKVLGLNIEERANALNQTERLPEEIQKLIAQRNTARTEKNWQESDRLRDEIVKKGYEILDSSEGTKIKKKS